MPVGASPFVVRVTATTLGTGASIAADIVVRRRTTPIAVELVDARPSWAATFVRRALEADPRFRVESVNGESRGITATTGDAVPLSDTQLDGFDAVVLGGLDRLTGNDVAGVRRYMRERGGPVVLLPDQRVDAGAVRPLLPEFTERLLERSALLVSPSGGGHCRDAHAGPRSRSGCRDDTVRCRPSARFVSGSRRLRGTRSPLHRRSMSR